ncbi:hypothetical protein [Flaviaesturariibacter amylovorans]|uniref:Prokaryotic RING finger family 4 n=1 Tax=Flaviaesturariibacter amylovorans TaxID=1084520 RepID=A0ABP8G7P2_9BACT
MYTLIPIALRQQALFVPASALQGPEPAQPAAAAAFVADLANAGFVPSTALLKALQSCSASWRASLRQVLQEVTGQQKNWTPLVRGWDVPTGESFLDHVTTFFANLFPGAGSGVRLSCGHRIPPRTFPLERYNGCPFCGTPFAVGTIEYSNQGGTLKVLDLWVEADAEAHLRALLASATALDATQADSLKKLLAHFPLPAGLSIKMKETVMLVIDALVDEGRAAEAQSFFTSPNDILRYLWYRHTGFLQVLRPGTIIKRSRNNSRHLVAPFDRSATAKAVTKASLKLHYSRRQGRTVAAWLNALPLSAEKICEEMHPKRALWVRFIRALRLAEHSKKEVFAPLRTVLDRFYRGDYPVWQGQVDRARSVRDTETTLSLLQQRPGAFARSLFANMLWLGPQRVTAAFAGVQAAVPPRLLLTLAMYADLYFERGGSRVVKPLGGVAKKIPVHGLLKAYTNAELEAMRAAVRTLGLRAVGDRFARQAAKGHTIYIDPALYRIPLAIGDRSETLQDLPSALMGTRFAVDGSTLRLFMQWGQGLPAQHLDMDLSCQVAYEGRSAYCSFANLVTTGCRHSGDIRSIPAQVGTAEYIDLDLDVLSAAGARYVTFTCNAYSNGSITPNLVVGWMNSRNPMRVSERTGVAYDPSCVQHMARIGQSLAKGLVFGVLDVAAREVIWLELPFGGQLVQGMDATAVRSYLQKLGSKLTVGELLAVKAEAQGLVPATAQEADEVYTAGWARDTAAVTALIAG